uniref:Uncharacterized protein n=1 Tax=Sphaerodactylus townsendi TaxID=933632 RepID=A0ACB8FL54_9SAUR
MGVQCAHAGCAVDPTPPISSQHLRCCHLGSTSPSQPQEGAHCIFLPDSGQRKSSAAHWLCYYHKREWFSQLLEGLLREATPFLPSHPLPSTEPRAYVWEQLPETCARTCKKA